jgi:hypothetical protein
VASVSGTAGASPTPSVSLHERLLQYTRCVREHGAPMADPRGSGEDELPGRIEAGFDKEKGDAALRACEALRPPIPQAQLQGKMNLVRLYARCMRDHGVDDFPDPGADGRTPIRPEVAADPQYAEAKRVCDQQLDAASASLRPSPSS